MSFDPLHLGYSVRPGYWFALRHAPNFGVVPVTWQAWLICAVYVVLLLAAVWRLPRGRNRSLVIVLLTIAGVAIAAITTDWLPPA